MRKIRGIKGARGEGEKGVKGKKKREGKNTRRFLWRQVSSVHSTLHHHWFVSLSLKNTSRRTTRFVSPRLASFSLACTRRVPFLSDSRAASPTLFWASPDDALALSGISPETDAARGHFGGLRSRHTHTTRASFCVEQIEGGGEKQRTYGAAYTSRSRAILREQRARERTHSWSEASEPADS